LNQANERNHYRKITCNETPIEVNKSRKTLNFTNKSWGNPIHNGLDLMRIHVNTISKIIYLRNSTFGLMELTFFQLNVKSNFLKLVQNKPNMLFIFLHVLGKNEDVIDITSHSIVHVSTKNIVHQILKKIGW
jgi:hypothetical protein